MVGITGSSGSLYWKVENSFKGAPHASETTSKIFGRGQRLSSLGRNENLEPVYELGQRTISSSAFKQREGTFSLEWVLSNPWFFYLVLGGKATSGMAAPYTHTFTSAKTLPSFKVYQELDLSTDIERQFDGCIMNSCTLSAAVGELVRCRADGFFADETSPMSPSFTAQPAEDTNFIPFSFVNANVYEPAAAGSPIAEVQSFEFTFNNNAQMLWGLGDKGGVSAIAQALDLTGRMTATFKDRTYLDKMRTRTADYKIVITNGLAGANEVSITLTGNGFLWNEHTYNVEPNALILEDIALRFEDVSVAAKNAVSTAPLFP